MPPKQLICHDRRKKPPAVKYYILTISSTGTIAWVCLSPITTQCEHTGCPVSLSKNSRGLLLCSGQPTAVSLLKNCTSKSKTYIYCIFKSPAAIWFCYNCLLIPYLISHYSSDDTQPHSIIVNYFVSHKCFTCLIISRKAWSHLLGNEVILVLVVNLLSLKKVFVYDIICAHHCGFNKFVPKQHLWFQLTPHLSSPNRKIE